jgi:hypothetical protein
MCDHHVEREDRRTRSLHEETAHDAAPRRAPDMYVLQGDVVTIDRVDRVI